MDPQAFDLRGVSAPNPLVRKTVRTLCFGFVAISVYGIARGAYELVVLGNSSIETGIFLIAIDPLFGLLTLWYGTISFSPAATSIQVGSGGISIDWPAEYSTVAHRQVPWTRFSRRVTLAAAAVSSAGWWGPGTSSDRSLVYRLNVPYARPIRLTVEASDAIISGARLAGLEVRGVDRSARGQTRRLTRFEQPMGPH